MSGLTVSTSTAWPLEYFIPIPQYIVPSTPTYLILNWSVRRPQFSACIGGGGEGEVLVFEPWLPRAPPTLPWSPFCLRNPTHSTDFNSNVLCRIPDHRLALVLPLIIPTTGYIFHLHLPFSEDRQVGTFENSCIKDYTSCRSSRRYGIGAGNRACCRLPLDLILLLQDCSLFLYPESALHP